MSRRGEGRSAPPPADAASAIRRPEDEAACIAYGHLRDATDARPLRPPALFFRKLTTPPLHAHPHAFDAFLDWFWFSVDLVSSFSDVACAGFVSVVRSFDA